MDTPVHRLDARAKALVTFAFIVVVMSFPRHAVAPLTPFLLYPLLLIALGRIPMRVIARKVLLAAPFAVLIGIFNPLLDRQPGLILGSFTISAGWLSFASILLRFVLTVGAALALVACTGMNRIGAALARLGVPRVFVVQLLFLYRYLSTISGQAVKMVRSAELRSSGRPLCFRAYGAMISQLLLRSIDRADRIHRAMLARGFTSEIRTLHPSAFHWPDTVFVAGCTLLFVAARIWNPTVHLGRLVGGHAG